MITLEDIDEAFERAITGELPPDEPHIDGTAIYKYQDGCSLELKGEMLLKYVIACMHKEMCRRIHTVSDLAEANPEFEMPEPYTPHDQDELNFFIKEID